MRSALRLSITFAFVATMLTTLSGCKSEDEKKEEAAWRMDTPLPHDPMDKDVLAQWWSNGKQLLRLQNDHYYALYDNNNRYTRPRERGRWDQDGYALLWLDPYNTAQADSTRVSITKIDGKLAILLPKLDPMFALKGPPPTREDQLVGVWQGPMGSLRLNTDMTYSLEPATGATLAGRPLAGHNGRWKFTGGEVVLAPATPSVSVTMLKVRDLPPPPAEGAAGTTQPVAPDAVLEGLGGELIKMKAASV